MLRDLILKNRSYRRFDESYKINAEDIKDLIDLGRLSPSASNKQPLKYVISCESEMNEKVFSCLAWAGYLKDWQGPSEGERPTAYITVLGDKGISGNFGCDHGIAAQSILLGATEMGLGGCMLGAVNRSKLSKILELDDKYEILLVIALGKPAEKVVLDDVGDDGDIKYWRESSGTHHVPKRGLDSLILK